MFRFSRNPVLRYAVAVASILLAVGLRVLLDPLLGESFPFLTLLIAVIVASAYGGYGPGLMAAGLGTVASIWLLLRGRSTFVPDRLQDQAGLALYFVGSLGMAALGGAMRSAKNRAEFFMEEALRQYEEMRTTLSSIGDGVIVTDSKGRVMLLNSVAEALTGWTSREARERPVEHVFHIVDEETNTKVESTLVHVLHEGIVVAATKARALIAKDGRKRPVDHSAAPIRSKKGELTGLVLVFRDVTDRRQAERELRESEERFRLMADNAPVLIWMSDLNKQYTFFNRAWLEFTGRAAEEEYGDGWMESLHPDDRQRCLESYSSALASRSSFRREYRLRRADGEYRWILDTGIPRLAKDGTFDGYIGSCIDISDRKDAEEAWRAQRKWFRITLRSIGDAVIATDIKGRVLFLNPVAQALTGWTQKEAELQPLEGVFRIINEYTRHPVENPASKALAEGTVIGLSGDTILLAKDGSERPIDDSAAPIQDEKGRVIGVVLIFRDVTERRRAEEARRHLAAIVESSDDAIISETFDGKITSWNKAAERLFGYVSEEIIGKPISLLAPLEHAGELPAVSEQVRRGETTKHFETKGRRKDGRTMDVSINISAIRDAQGSVVGASAIARDITERKRKEQTARFLAHVSTTVASLVDYELTLQTVAKLAVPFFADWCAISMLEANGSLRRAALAHTDPTKVELAQKLFQRFPDDPGPRHGTLNVLRTGKPRLISDLNESVLRERIQDDELFTMAQNLGLRSYMAMPLSARGKTIGVITFILAESGRRYEDPDLAVGEELAYRAAVAIENAQLYQALKESDKRKNEFLAMLAHELRNPLAPVRNALHILKVSPNNPSVSAQARDMAERQVHYLTRLVDDLLDVSRIMRGKIELRKERLELSTLIGRAVETAQPLIDSGGHELTVSVPDQPVCLEADLIRMAQVISNLLNNAAKYTQSGGHIWLTAEEADDQVLIRVRDSGIGIDPEMLPRIFDMFMQVAPTDARSQGGLGIGLTLVRNLVEMHHGTVEAHSAGLEQGSEFIVRLPAAQVNRQGGSETRLDPCEPTPPSPHCRVLVVDDNVDAADSLGMLLRLQGHDVKIAHSGPEALEAVRESEPQLILLDLGMPGMDGYEVARRVRSEHGSSNIVIAALTGWGQEQDRQRSKAAGFQHHLTKPIELSALEALFETCQQRKCSGSNGSRESQ